MTVMFANNMLTWYTICNFSLTSFTVSLQLQPYKSIYSRTNIKRYTCRYLPIAGEVAEGLEIASAGPSIGGPKVILNIFD